MCDDRELDLCTTQEILEWGKEFYEDYVQQWISGLRLSAKILQESNK